MFQQEGHFNIDGASIYYEVSGNPNGKPLLMIHGGLGCMYDLMLLLDYVPEDYKVILVDLRGHGQSTLGEVALSYERYQQDVEQLLRSLNISTYSVFGFSDGGTVAYRLAASQPELVEKIVTLGSHWRLPQNDSSEAILGSVSEKMWREQFPKDVARYEEINPSPDFGALIEKVKAVWLDKTPTGYPSESIQRIGCPSLVIRGNNDFLLSANEALLAVNQLPDAEFMNVPFSAHATHQEFPEMVGFALNRFLSFTL
ncbi:oxidoreductase [Vibrio sp. vnigr-6D03]|uniref:alpha/beta fold hydrolase n=1 Tax=Vibrio sp. vnigr-6D03 TaxID=2058088 RepID=UPI000C348FE9|nr:alpha/beta hydrolase [Vibrio sp. vnigr-6D03]PKF79884.1 oxidoreductase [Vibrio sp. vnigr-6D03]